jgi:AcrR family transcriptional regulator
MAFTTHLLVVANRTVDSPELLAALRQRAEEGPIHVTLLAPTLWSEREEARERVQAAVDGLEAAGVRADGTLGDADPIVAVQEAWNPGRYDEVLVSTLTEGASRWLQIDLPHRVARLTDCQVRHIAVPVRRPQPPPPTPPPARRPMLESVLSLMRSSTRSRAA